MCPRNNYMSNNYGQTKKVVKDIGNDVIHIYYCRKGCMLFFQEDLNLHTCKFYGHSRWIRQRSQQRNQSSLPFARMHYLPLKPWLQRLHASRSTAQRMRRHYEHWHEDCILCHTSDGAAESRGKSTFILWSCQCRWRWCWQWRWCRWLSAYELLCISVLTWKIIDCDLNFKNICCLPIMLSE